MTLLRSPAKGQVRQRRPWKSCEGNRWRDFNQNLHKYFMHSGDELLTFTRSMDSKVNVTDNI